MGACRFQLEDADRYGVQELVKLVQEILIASVANPARVHTLATLLFALRRLPLATPGVDVRLEISVDYQNGDAAYSRLSFDAEVLTLGIGGVNHTGGAGGDAWAEDEFVVERDNRDDGSPACRPEAWVMKTRALWHDKETRVVIHDHSAHNRVPWTQRLVDAWTFDGDDEDRSS